MKAVKRFEFSKEALTELCEKNNIAVNCLDEFTNDWLAEDIQDLLNKGKESEFYEEAKKELIHCFEVMFSEILYNYLPPGMTSDEFFFRFQDTILEIYSFYFSEAACATRLDLSNFDPLKNRKDRAVDNLIQGIDDMIEHYNQE
jgi:hypothetical protein